MAVKQVQVDKSVEQPNKVLDMIGYLIFLVPLFTMKNEFDRFHANQAVLIVLTSLVINALSVAVLFIPVVGWMVSLALNIANIGILVLIVMGIVNVSNLECKPVPVIGNLCQIIKY